MTDAVGGKVKEMCDRFVADGNDTCAACMSDFDNESHSVIKCYQVVTADISGIRDKAVKETTKVHQVVWDKSKPNELFFVV